MFDVGLIERNSGTQDGRYVISVPLAPGDQLVNDDVLGSDDAISRPVERDTLIFHADK
jgi:hypothetical protein